MNLREIAKRANVSIATVSRTINCAPNVDPSLARRVRKVIEQVGYYPNTHARALVSGRSRIFGLMVSETVEPFFPEILQTFESLGVRAQLRNTPEFNRQRPATDGGGSAAHDRAPGRGVSNSEF